MVVAAEPRVTGWRVMRWGLVGFGWWPPPACSPHTQLGPLPATLTQTHRAPGGLNCPQPIFSWLPVPPTLLCMVNNTVVVSHAKPQPVHALQIH
eukprot:365255-Chlamydomonas_euryale.AAC.23